MNVLIANTQDMTGGAARAAYRLHKGLQKIGINSQMLVQTKSSRDNSVIKVNGRVHKRLGRFYSRLDKIPLRKYKERHNVPWSPGWLWSSTAKQISRIKPDIVNLHWICGGFIPIKTLAKINLPIVWTLHDAWAFTGGCHYQYPQDCLGYQKKCGRCHEIGSKKEKDLSRWVWNQKKKHWKELDFTIVTPSRWLSRCAKSSSLFKDMRVEVIHNGIDGRVFKPLDKEFSREILNIPMDKRIILMGAMSSTSDPIKGFQYLKPALNQLAEKGLKDETELLVFGAYKPLNTPDMGFNTHYMGYFNDDTTLALLYSAADVFVAPSITENLANTVNESLACGTPCVAFNIGGMPDMIEHNKNGYLAKPFETDDLANGIAWIIEDENRHSKLSIEARRTFEKKFELNVIARQFAKLYEEVLNDRK